MSRIASLSKVLRLAAVLAGAAMVAAACAPASNPPSFSPTIGGQLIPEVVDSVNDAGRGDSVALDAQGNPVASYVLTTAILKPGELVPAITPGQPQPPSVILASRSKGIWTRTAVTGLAATGKAVGKATEIVDDNGIALPGISTSLAIDSQGKHHVAWSTPNGLFYADDAAGTGGAFGTPEQVTANPAIGGSIAVTATGTSMVSYYSNTDFSIHLATRGATGWTDQVVDGTAGLQLPPQDTALRIDANGNPVVAYGANGATIVATGNDGGWTTSPVSGPGGYGVSLALDKDGNPMVASYDQDGGVHLARSSGGAWQVTGLGRTTSRAKGQPDLGWSTAVGVDDAGRVYVAWADTSAQLIRLASGAAGSLRPRTVPGSNNGQNPSLAVSADGKSFVLGWYDGLNGDFDAAIPPSGGLSLAFPTPPLAQPSITTPPASPSCKPNGATIQVVAKNIAFDQSCFAAPAGQAFTIDFNNQDAGVPHNFEVYTDSSAATRLAGASGPGDIITGPGTATYKSSALKAGVYYFRCDIHPTQMFGQFVVGP